MPTSHDLSGSDTLQWSPTSVAIRELQRAWLFGRPIIPLFGAGLSADSGVPTASELGAYLAKLAVSPDIHPEATPTWPDSSKLNINLFRAHRPDEGSPFKQYSTALYTRLQEYLEGEFSDHPRVAPSVTDDNLVMRVHDRLGARWRALLRGCCGTMSTNAHSLVDHVLDRKRPSRGHALVAFLSQIIGWRVILTTNFDSLIETALSMHGITYTAIELRPDGNDPISSPQEHQRLVLKLHGGRNSVQSDDFLDTPFDEAQLNRMSPLFGRNPLLLVVGYRCRDRRVASLINYFLRGARGKSDPACPNAIWICRHNPPVQTSVLARHTERPALVLSQYGDASLFLQELFVRLTSSFPVSPVPLSLLQQSTPRLRGPAAGPGRSVSASSQMGENATTQSPTARDSAVTVLYSDGTGGATSSNLATLASVASRTMRVIWCDAEEFSSVGSIVRHILAQIRTHDSSVAVPLRTGERAVDLVDGRVGHQSLLHRRLLPRLVAALQRGRYFLAIDSAAEFGRAHLGHSVFDGQQRCFLERLQEFYDFLVDVANSAKDLGESRVAFSFCPSLIRTASSVASECDAPEFPALCLPAQRVAAPADPAGACIPTTTEWRPSKSDAPDSCDFDLQDGTDAASLPVPSDIPGYEVLGVVGRGGTGLVLKVREKTTDRVYACKVLKAKVGGTPSAREFFEEARIAGSLQHVSIPAYHHSDRLPDPDGRLYIVTDYVDGASLSALIAAGTDKRWLVHVIRQVAAALHHAHGAGIIHRDVKPRNIVVDKKGSAFLIDFGLARNREVLQLPRVTISGTVSYMSPEQTRGSALTPASDQFSLGVVLYEAMTGTHPFAAPTIRETFEKIRTTTVAGLGSSGHEFSGIATICLKALRKKPEDRYAHVQMFADALTRWLQKRSVRQSTSNSMKARGAFEAAVRELRALSNDGPGELTQFVHLPAGEEYIRGDAREDAIAKALAPEHQPFAKGCVSQILELGNTREAAIAVLWDDLDRSIKRILGLAAAFRRPRSILALRRIGLEMFHAAADESADSLPLLDDVSSSGSIFSHSEVVSAIDADRAEDAPDLLAEQLCHYEFGIVDGIVELCEKLEFLVPEPGGNYWMFSEVRDYIHQACVRDDPEAISNLHQRVALYYYNDVYGSARDITALAEAISHTVIAVKYCPGQRRLGRVRLLHQLLLRERASLLAHLDGEVLIGMFTELREEFLPWYESEIRKAEGYDGSCADHDFAACASLRALVCSVLGDAFRRANRNHDMILLRLRQVRDRVGECKALRDALGDQVASLGTGPSYSALEFVRILDTAGRPEVIDACLGSPAERRCFIHLLLHFASLARGLIGIGEARAAEELLSRIVCAGEECESLGHGRGDRELAAGGTSVLIEAQLCLLELWNSRVRTWTRDADQPHAIEQVEALVRRLQGNLGEFPESALDGPRSEALVVVHAIEARILCVRGFFTEAIRVLDRGVRVAGYERFAGANHLRAICEIQRAECQMRHAEEILQHADTHSLGCAWRMLELAAGAIELATAMLEGDGGDVQQWATVFHTRAQLCHERILAWSAEFTGEAWEQERIYNEIVDGLRSLSSAWDNVSDDTVIATSIRGLWYQFFVCLVVARRWGSRNQSGSTEFEDACLEWNRACVQSQTDWLQDRLWEPEEFRQVAQAVLEYLGSWDGLGTLRERVLLAQRRVLDNGSTLDARHIHAKAGEVLIFERTVASCVGKLGAAENDLGTLREAVAEILGKFDGKVCRDTGFQESH